MHKAIARLCAQLDGIPLAIGWRQRVNLLPVEQISLRLTENLDILTAPRTTLPGTDAAPQLTGATTC
jgi:hypothetical protein